MQAQMSKQQKKVLIRQMSGQPVAQKQRKPRRPRAARKNPQSQIVVASVPLRNGQGRKRGQRRQRGGNSVTTAGNMRSFIIPIDEQVALVSGSTGFAIAAYPINPGSNLAFPFASRTAQNYERYEFQNLRYEFRPSATMFATVGTQGFVGITGTMDALQAPPSSQQGCEIMLHSPIMETAKPTALSFPKQFLLTKSQREKFFVRPNGFIPGGADPHLYDCGQVFIWTNGQANTNLIGELRVVGSCKLSNPVLETSTSVPPTFNVAQFTQANTVTALTSTISIPLPLVNVTVNGLGISNVAGTFTLPVGNYQVSGEVDFAASGMSTVFTANLQKNGATNYVKTYSLPSGLYPLWSCPVTPYFVISNGTDTFQLQAQTTYSNGATTAGGTLNFNSV